jgi:CheY-like chemotaxis protein
VSVPRSPLVLLVEDDAAIREWVLDGLALFGFRAVEAVDGADALIKAGALKPDVLLLDLQIPGVNGWEVMRRLKRDPETAHIRCIAMTGYSMDGAARQEARACGCDAFLAKPCLPETIALEIRLVLQAEEAGEIE